MPKIHNSPLKTIERQISRLQQSKLIEGSSKAGGYVIINTP